MEFFLEMVLTATVALLFSFVVAKLMPVATAGGGNGPRADSEEKSGIHVGEDVVDEKLRFGQKMEARVLGSERNVGIVDDNVEHVDRFVSEAVRVDEPEAASTATEEIGSEREVLAVESSEADSTAVVSPEYVEAEDLLVRGQEEGETESAAAVSPENLVAKGMIVGGEEERRAGSAVAVSPENVTAEVIGVGGQEGREAESGAVVSLEKLIAEEMIVVGQEERRAESKATVSPEDVTAEEMGVGGGEDERQSESGVALSPGNVVAEEMIVRGQGEGSESTEERSEHAEIQQSGDVAVAESEENRVEESECKEGIPEKTEELNIEDDWEGIEKSELEKAFAAAAKFVEESGDVLEIGNESQTELYGLHKIATEGPCRDSPPMALMVSARAKWNAWQKLGNMSQEEAMEQYLALVSKEIPGQAHADSTVEKEPETETSVVLSPDSDSKYEAVEGAINEASDLDNKAKPDSSV